MTGRWTLRLTAEPLQHQLHNPGLKVNPQRRRSIGRVQSKKQRYEPHRPIICTALLIDVTPELFALRCVSVPWDSNRFVKILGFVADDVWTACMAFLLPHCAFSFEL